MSETDTSPQKKSLMNNIVDGLNKEQVLQKIVEPVLDYTKNKIKPYYITLIVILLVIVLLLLYILYMMMNKKTL
jgi:predicted PurR-regulated permease PerM